MMGIGTDALTAPAERGHERREPQAIYNLHTLYRTYE